MKNNQYKEIYRLQRAKKDAKAIDKLLDSRGRLKSFFRKDKNHAWYVVGVSLYSLDDHFCALQCFKKSLRFNKKDDACMLAIGNCHDRLGNYKLAEKWFSRVISHAKDEESRDAATYNLGNSLFDQKKYRKAMKCYKLVAQRHDETGEMARKNMNILKRISD